MNSYIPAQHYKSHNATDPMASIAACCYNAIQCCNLHFEQINEVIHYK